ncbi:MAG: HAD-IC family P-type ATPase [Acidimicrobiales bacterium]
MTLVSRVADGLTYSGRSRRRMWQTAGRIHLEVKGLDGPAAAAVARLLRKALQDLPGVSWVDVDVISRRAIVAFAEESILAEQLIDAVEKAEECAGVGRERFALDLPESPADREPIRRHWLALGADVAGLGLAGLGRLLRSTPFPVEAASVVTLIDNEPRLRRFLESRLGSPATDLGLAVANALGQSLTQGPLGLLIDGAHRATLLSEAVARRSAFETAEARRWGQGPPRSRPRDFYGDLSSPRPVPLPAGAVERFADRSALVGVVGAAGTLAATGSARRGAAMLLAAAPKAARVGREAFAAHLDRALAARDLVVLDAEALRRLDRVDTVVIDEALLRTARSVIGGVRLLPDADAPEAHRRLSTLFDPAAPRSSRRRGRWELSAPTSAERRQGATHDSLRGFGSGQALVLRCAGRPVAVASVEEELSTAAISLIRSARGQGHMVAIAGSDLALLDRCGADLLVVGGPGMAEAIRSLQADGCVVAVIAPGSFDNAPALHAGDVSLEVPSFDGSAWAGDIILNDTLDAAFVLDAIGTARHVSRQSVALSACGAGIGSLLALTGRPATAAGRVSLPINLAALAAMVNGLRAAAYLNRQGGRVAADPVRWHQMDVAAVLKRVSSTAQGLSEQEARRRWGQASSPQERPASFLYSLARELNNPLTPVLLGGAAASAAVGSPADAGIVAGVTGLNALIAGIQRFAAERAILSLGTASASNVSVRRPSGVTFARADRLVPGDVVVLRSGDAVPADCRVMTDDNAQVDESSLTGESDPVVKGSTPTFSAVLAERSCMIHEGTSVAAGEMEAIVVAVGRDTAANAMAADVVQTEASGGVEGRLRRLTSITLPVAAGGGLAVAGLGLLRGHGLDRSVGSAVALAVAAVPEGLPLLATMAQLASARRLSNHQALVPNPRAIEALGRVRVLCTDKTGTLTEGRIRLRRVSNGLDDVSLHDLGPAGQSALAAALRASPAHALDQPAAHPTDQAVIEGAHQRGLTVSTGMPTWRRRCELPFEPSRGYHAVIGGPGGPAGEVLSAKGAPEVLIPRCTHWRGPRGEAPIDEMARRQLDHEVERLARQGLRVLAVAEGPAADARSNGDMSDTDVSGLTLLGFLVLSDPVRATAAKAIAGLRAAGVDVVMVTGDHPSTAEGIAVELGILDGRRVMTGTQLENLTDEELNVVISDVSVFARVTPGDKVRIVAALQRRGQAVAMTGDGANDAPAIRLADVGIALGARATPAARRAADLVVTDERIETIVDAIIEGRAMWGSVREALAILLGGNLGEVAFTVAATAVSGASPLSARQLLTVNLLTDVAPALAIAVRPPPERSPAALLAEGPDASLGESLERAIIVRAAGTALGAGMAWTGARLTGRRQRASTTALVALVGAQLGQTIASGGFDPWVLAAAGVSATVLTVIVQTPGLSQFFGCTPLGPAAWAMAVGSATVATGASALAARWIYQSHSGPEGLPALTEPAESTVL